MVVIGTTVCGQNMTIIRTAATAIETSALISRSRRSRIRAGSSGSSSIAVPGASGRTSYPAASMAATTSGRPTSVGSTVTVARSVARFTLASRTPSVLLRNRSIRLTHDAQVMPSIGSTISIGFALSGIGAVAVILPGSIPRRSCPEPATNWEGVVSLDFSTCSSPATEAPSVQSLLPVPWDAPGRTRRRLVERVVPRRSQGRPLDLVLGDVVPEPVLAGLVALSDRMTGIGRVMARVLRRRRVAAADMTARRAAAKMEPPSAGRQALDTARSARRDQWIDRFVSRHQHMVSVNGQARSRR